MYYVLFCFEQLNLNPENSPIVIAGNFSESTHKMIFKYIRHVSIYKSKVDLNHKFYSEFQKQTNVQFIINENCFWKSQGKKN